MAERIRRKKTRGSRRRRRRGRGRESGARERYHAAARHGCVCVCTVEFVTVFSVALELRALFTNGFNDRYGPFKLWMTQ